MCQVFTAVPRPALCGQTPDGEQNGLWPISVGSLAGEARSPVLAPELGFGCTRQQRGWLGLSNCRKRKTQV